MKSKKIENTYILKLEKGEEIVQTLTKFCTDQGITGGSVSGIGGIRDVGLMYYDVKVKKYIPRDFGKKVYEMTSLLGNVSLVDNKPFVHLHATIADETYQTFGGHLGSATVAVTCEIFIHTVKNPLHRSINEEFGLKFLDI